MKHRVLLLVFLVIFSCGKDSTDNDPIPIPDAIPKVIIDSDQLSRLDFISIQASTVDVVRHSMTKVGVVWGESSDPTIEENLFLESENVDTEFTFVIERAGFFKTFYVRAWIERGGLIIYSEEVEVTTDGLTTIWDNEINSSGSWLPMSAHLSDDEMSIYVLNRVLGDPITWTALTRIDTSGNVIWQKEYDVGESSDPVTILQLQDGFVIATSEETIDFSGRIHHLIKTDFQGEIVWRKQFKKQRNQDFVRLRKTESGNISFALRAYDDRTDGVRTNASIYEFDMEPSGNSLGERMIAVDNKSNSGSYAFKVLSTLDGGMMFANYYESPNNGTLYDLLIQRYNIDYELVWEFVYDGGGTEYPVEFKEDVNGDVILLASSEISGLTEEKLVLLSLNKASGALNNEYTSQYSTYGESLNTYPTALTYNETSSLLVNGYWDSGSYLGKFDLDGNIIWDYNVDKKQEDRTLRGIGTVSNSIGELFVLNLHGRQSGSVVSLVKLRQGL